MADVPAAIDRAISVPILRLLGLGASICGVTEGDVGPQVFIPYFLDLYQRGEFPFRLLITSYPLEAVNEAVEDQRKGRCVKAILTIASRL